MRRNPFVLVFLFFTSFSACSAITPIDSGTDSDTTEFADNELIWACPADGSVAFESISQLRSATLTTSGDDEIGTGSGKIIRVLGNVAEDYDAILLEPVFYLTDVVLIEMTDGRFVVAQTNLTPQNWYFNSSNTEYIQTKMYFYEGDTDTITAAVDSVLAGMQARDATGENLGDASILDELDQNPNLNKVAMVVPKLTPLGGNTAVTFADDSSYTLTTTIGADEITLYVDSDSDDYVELFAQYTGMTLTLDLAYAQTELTADYPELFLYASSLFSVDNTYVLLDAENTALGTYLGDTYDPYDLFYQKCGMALTADSETRAAVEVIELE